MNAHSKMDFLGKLRGRRRHSGRCVSGFHEQWSWRGSTKATLPDYHQSCNATSGCGEDACCKRLVFLLFYPSIEFFPLSFFQGLNTSLACTKEGRKSRLAFDLNCWNASCELLLNDLGQAFCQKIPFNFVTATDDRRTVRVI